MRQMQSFSNSIKSIYLRLGRIPFIFAFIAIAIYFWVNGQAHFPNWESSHKNLVMVYIIMMLAFYVWANKRTEVEFKQSLNKVAFSFVFFFFITWGIMAGLVALNVLQPSTSFPIELFWVTVMLQICVVATAEEVIFRGILLSYTGIFIQALLFAIWHSWAYGILWYDLNWETFNWSALAFAFIMGIILGYVATNKKFGGLSATIAIHSCYNLVILGALSI